MPVLHAAATLANIKAWRDISTRHVKVVAEVTVADGEGTPIFFIGKPQCPSRGFQVVLSATPRGRRPRPPPNHGRMSPGGGDKGHLTVLGSTDPGLVLYLAPGPSALDRHQPAFPYHGRMGSRTERPPFGRVGLLAMLELESSWYSLGVQVFWPCPKSAKCT